MSNKKETVVSRKRYALIFLVAFVLLVVAVGAYGLYCAYHPTIVILHGQSNSDYSAGVFHSETIGVARGYHPDAPVAKSVRSELDRMHDWIDQVETELHEYSKNRPYYISVSGENDLGKITLRYEGCVTDSDRETRDYKNEETFHIYVRPENFQLK